eukprot:TRINITY_DN27703_c0_g1_i1.p1 TRINITY_DN27703_c0_g1~~TRINITY_DN27703_c0_g1_i1.p1  ORF type:complete len:240 (+),score=35.43 TRINITY_DN27703_c0_g1_i1:24-743(+)
MQFCECLDMPSFRQRAKKRDEKLVNAASQLPLGQPLSGLSVTRLGRELMAQVSSLHTARLPVRYSDEYFESALLNPRWSRLAMWDGMVAGAVICKELDGGLRVQSIVAAVARRGIGSRLLGVVLAEADKQGIPTSSLHVHVKNEPAIALYKSLGFRTQVTKEGYYQRSSSNLEPPWDAHFMVRPRADSDVCSSRVNTCIKGTATHNAKLERMQCLLDDEVQVDDLNNTASHVADANVSQ